MRLLGSGLGLGVLVLFAVPHGASGTPRGFGPQTYVRVPGAPITITEPFAVCSPDRRAFRLQVENGPGGRPRVSSATIAVNGVEIVRERDFNQEVGSVERPVTLRDANSLAVRLAGQPGGVVAVSVTSKDPCLEVAFSSPAGGASVPAGPLLVRGTVRGAPEVGVTINHEPALVDGETFAALVLLVPGVNELAAVATTPGGETAEIQQPLSVSPAAESTLRLHSDPPGGTAPLTVGFSLSSLVGITDVTLDMKGNGAVDFQGPTLDGQSFVYLQPGVYAPTVRVTDPEGRVHAATTLIEVYDAQTLDARLQAAWRNLRDALRAGDVARALRFIHSHARQRYERLFTQLASTELAQIDRHMTSIQLVEVGFGGAQYEMLREEGDETLSFAVWFQLDLDGLWRLRRF